MRKHKSLTVNMTLNVIRGVLAIAFPLITFPYISNVLGVDQLGAFNFSSSIIGYFILIENLGISDYALREGAYRRDNRKEFTEFANEVETVNFLGVCLSTLLFLLSLLTITKLRSYSTILIILSIQLLFKPLAMDWINGVYEDFIYITLRNIGIQVLSVAAMFIFVKSPEDVVVYAMIISGSCVATSVLNLINIRKYYTLRFTKTPNIKKHIKPMLYIFATSLAATIYINSDVTILGFLCTDVDVGVYSVSTKVYSVVKAIISSALLVSVPRLSAFLGQGKFSEFEALTEKIYNVMITITLPIICGLFMLSKSVVVIISNENYINAYVALRILSIALISSMGAWIWSYCVLIPMKKEKTVFKVTLLSAVINIASNLVLIPIGKGNAAALTTLISEVVCFIVLSKESKKSGITVKLFPVLWRSLVGCVAIIVVCSILTRLITSDLKLIIFCFISSSIIYFCIQLLLKNPIVFFFVKKIKSIIIRGKAV